MNREGLAIFTGSFYLVGEAKKHLASVAAKRSAAAAAASGSTSCGSDESR